MANRAPLSQRSFARRSSADSWEEIWEAGPYFDRISHLMEEARDYIILVGWQIDSRLPLRGESLKDKLLRLCENKPHLRAYLLMWDHASFYMVEREFAQGRIWDEVHPRIHFVFDNRHPFGGSHHEKICIIDGHTALCGGIDLCDERWDTRDHAYTNPLRSLDQRLEHHGPYHDMGVQVTGRICQELQRHVARRWHRISSIRFPPLLRSPLLGVVPGKSPGHTIYFSRTLSRIDPTRSSNSTREIEFLFRDLIRSARKRIILEGQYYWSRKVNDLIIAEMVNRMKEDRKNRFEVVLILANLSQVNSPTRVMSRYELTLLNRLEQAARFTGCKLTVAFPYSYPAPASMAHPARPVYVHSKVIVIDDRYLSIGSANLAARAFRLDTEVHLTYEAETLEQRRHIARFSEELLDHWNLGKEKPSCCSVEARPISPLHHLLEADRARWFARPAFPWQFFFDPELPWLFRTKRRLIALTRRRPVTVPALATALVIAGGTLSVILFRALSGGGFETPWAALYCGVLSSVWLFPVPFIGVSLLAGFHLGADAGATAAVASLWVASIISYGLARMFPTAVTRFWRNTGVRRGFRLKGIRRTLRTRRFGSLLAIVFDPRIDIRSKLVLQGLACIPMAWFALASLLLLPAAIQLLIRCAVRVLAVLI